MPVKTITAEIDGQVRKITADIPDDATQEEIMSAVSSYKTTTSVAQSKPQGMIDRVMNARGMEGGDPIQTLKAMGVKAGNEYDAKRNSDNQIEAVRPYSIGPAVALGTRAAAMTPGPIPLKAVVGAAAGGSAYFGLDTLLKNLESDPSQSSDSVSNLAINLVMGKAIEKGISGGRAFIAEMNNPGSVVGKMARLFPTFSQIKDSKLASMFEDFFATKSKTTSIERSALVGKAEAEVMATGSTKTPNLPAGRPIAEIRDPHTMARHIQQSAIDAEASMQSESNAQAETVKNIAGGIKRDVETQIIPANLTDPKNPLRIKSGTGTPAVAATIGTPGTTSIPATLGTPAKSAIPPVYLREVQGPIQLNGTLEEAQNYLLDQQKKWGDITKNVNLAPADERPLINAAQNLIRVTDTIIDKQTGAIVSHNPVSFEDAWNFKKLSDSTFKTNPRAANISRALNNDIDNSITSWQSPNKDKALASWQSSKKIVGDRIALFEKDANGQLPTLGRLINQVDGSPIGTVDDIIRDPVKLQRALTLNEVKFPNGTVKSTNMRGDLRGYHTQQLFDSAWVNESANSTKQVFSASKIMDEINDPRMQKSLSLLYPGTARDNLTEFVTELAKTQQKMAVAGPWIKYVMPIRGGIALTAGLATGAMSGSGLYGGAITGLVLGGSAVARLMTNPTTARLMVALAKGQKLGSDVWMSRAIASALQGSHAALTVKYQDGTQIRSELDKDNKFQPIE